MKPTHLKILGTTGVGKSVVLNELHRTFPDTTRDSRTITVLVDTKGGGNYWGQKIQNLDQASRFAATGRNKLVWNPPRGVDGIIWEAAHEQLLRFWGRVQNVGAKEGWSHDKDPWIQLLVDEAQRWEEPYQGQDGKRHVPPRTLQDMAAVGLGLGLRLVYATQYPANLDTATRDNLTASIVLRLGEEAWRTVEAWRWPVEQLRAHTSKPYHYATNDPVHGWRYHPPIRRG